MPLRRLISLHAHAQGQTRTANANSLSIVPPGKAQTKLLIQDPRQSPVPLAKRTLGHTSQNIFHDVQEPAALAAHSHR
jgi:hypothetical protein